MEKVRLGSTGITVNKNGFGALPIQRISREAAAEILRAAYDAGITYFDTARFYTDSEEKLGYALSGIRDRIYIATKTMCRDTAEFWQQLDTSLAMLKTDYIDVYQFHNPAFCPKPGDGSGLYEAMLAAKAQGKIRHIGITNHRLPVALEAVESGLYETLQFPFSYLAAADEIALVRRCEEKDVGFVAMKALSGGLITNAAAAFAFLAGYDTVLPIWGIQAMAELAEFVAHEKNPPALTKALRAEIEKDIQELGGEFCRGCGYCLPCPAEIDIPTSARMAQLLRRAPAAMYLSPEWREKMARVEDCVQCGHCRGHCPYGLDTPRLLRENYEDYKTFLN